MGKKYSDVQLREEINNFFEKDGKLFYQEKFINYQNDSNRIAKILLEDNGNLLVKLKKSIKNEKNNPKREQDEKPYNMGHNGWSDITSRENKGLLQEYNEKNFAIGLFNLSKDFPFGKIKDYQTPLKGSQKDPHGEIDLFAVDDNNKIVSLIELKIKKDKKTDTLLRSVLEIYTYFNNLNKEKFLRNFNLPEDSKFKLIVLAEESSLSCDHIDNIIDNISKYKEVSELFKEFAKDVAEGIEFYGFDYKYDKSTGPFNLTEKKGNKTRIELTGEIVCKQKFTIIAK